MSDEVATRLAARLDRRGLGEPARVLIDAHRPLAPLLSNLGAAIAPFLRLWPGGRGPEVAAFAADERALDHLLDALEAAGEPDAQPR